MTVDGEWTQTEVEMGVIFSCWCEFRRKEVSDEGSFLFVCPCEVATIHLGYSDLTVSIYEAAKS